MKESLSPLFQCILQLINLTQHLIQSLLPFTVQWSPTHHIGKIFLEMVNFI